MTLCVRRYTEFLFWDDVPKCVIMLYCWTPSWFVCLDAVHLRLPDRDVNRAHRRTSTAAAARRLHQPDTESYSSPVEPHRSVSKHLQWEVVWTDAGLLFHTFVIRWECDFTDSAHFLHTMLIQLGPFSVQFHGDCP